jgi:acetyltransferase
LPESDSTRADLENILADAAGTLDEHQAKQILSLCNIPVVEEKIVSTSVEARQAAEAFGYPVVVKGILAGEIHKTERGLVRIGVSSAAEAETAFGEMQKILKNDGYVLVQKQIQGYPELIAGLIRDPQFGPCVMCGFGGILTEVMADSVFAAAPLNRAEALAMLERLKTRQLLNGFRGFAPVDRDCVADILVRLGELGETFDRIKEIDINPLIVRKGKPIAVDARIIVETDAGVRE